MQNLIHTAPVVGTPAVVPSAIIPPLDVTPVAPAPMVVRKGEGLYGDQSIYRGYLKLDAQSTGGAFILLDVEVNSGKGVPAHIHTREDELFHIVEGRFEIQVGNKIYEAGPGDTVFAKRNIPHSWYCRSEEGGRLFILVTPGANFESYLRETELAQQAAMTALQDPTAAAFMELAESYGMTMLPRGIEGEARRVKPTKGRFVNLGDHYGTLNVSSQDTDGAFLWFDMDVDYQGGPPPHIHGSEDELFIIQKGRFRAMLGETFTEVSAGDIIYGPRGFAHCWQCITEEGGNAIVLVTPSENFETFAGSMESGKLMPPTTPDAVEKLLTLAERHDLQMLPPVW